MIVQRSKSVVIGTVLLLLLPGPACRAADAEDWLPRQVRPVSRLSL